jgi:hypothetical protein
MQSGDLDVHGFPVRMHRIQALRLTWAKTGEKNMAEKERTNMDRRKFMKSSFMAVGTTFCLSVGLREAIANSKLTGAPLLTADTLNQKFAAARSARTLSAMATEMKRDIPLWLRTNFSLTQLQAQALKSIPLSVWSEIKKVLSFVETKRDASLLVGIDGDATTTKGAAAMACRAKVKVTASAEVDGVYTSASASADVTAQ